MQLKAFSCVRPQLNQAAEALGYLSCARQVAGTEAPLEGRLASELFMTDASRALYLCELRDLASRTVTGLVGCLGVSDITSGHVTCTERLMPTDVAAHQQAVAQVVSASEQLGAQDEVATLAHPTSFALDVIVTAAKSATPLWKFETQDGNELTVWRMSRPEALEALEATFASIEGAVIRDERSQLVAEAAELAHERAQAAATVATGMEPTASFPVFLVPANQLSGAGAPTLPRGLFSRRTR